MKKFIKILCVVLCLALVAGLCVGLTACQDNEDFKIGLICLHDQNSTYDKNFIDAMYEAQKTLGLKDSQIIIKTGVEEDDNCYKAAADLVDQGCDIIFADSFGHEDYIIKAAKEFPNVQFCHATGTQAHTAGVANFHNAFAAIYEGRYLAGIAAGMKLNEMITGGTITAEQAIMGYVGAYPYEEVKSGYSSFYLGAKSVCPSVTMKVQFTNSWYDETLEANTAKNLIENNGCVLISQHADSWGAPTTCENKNVPNVSYNGSTESRCPNTFIISSRINWAPYYVYAANCVKKGETIPADWTGTIATGSVVITDLGATAPASGTAEAIAAAKAKLEEGTLNVFAGQYLKDKEGNPITSYMANVDSDPAYTPDTQVVANGVFEESKYRSAPYFGIDLQGITIIE